MAKWFVCYLSKKNILFAKNILYFKSRKELIVYLIITFTQYSEI